MSATSVNQDIFGRLSAEQQAAALMAVVGGVAAPGGNGNGKVVETPAERDWGQYRAEDGGILDAWMDVYGRDRCYVAGWAEWRGWTGSRWEPMPGHELHAEIIDLIDEANRFWGRRRAITSGADKEALRLVNAYLAATRRTGSRWPVSRIWRGRCGSLI